MRHVSIVVFDVEIDSDDLSDVEVMQKVFAQSEAIHLRSMSPLTYQSGSYERTISTPEIWTGRLERIRTGPVSTVLQKPDGSYHFVDEELAIPTSHATTYYAFAPDAGLLIYKDMMEMPYTRLASYVSGALRKAASTGIHAQCTLTPRQIDRPFREWIQHFTTIERVRVQLRHSQSPGNRVIDHILEQLNADTATEAVTAAPKQHLRKEALLDHQIPISQAIDHLEQSSKNGQAEIAGHVGEQRVKYSSRSPIERHLVELDDDDDVLRMRSLLARFAAKLANIGQRT